MPLNIFILGLALVFLVECRCPDASRYIICTMGSLHSTSSFTFIPLGVITQVMQESSTCDTIRYTSKFLWETGWYGAKYIVQTTRKSMAEMVNTACHPSLHRIVNSEAKAVFGIFALDFSRSLHFFTSYLPQQNLMLAWISDISLSYIFLSGTDEEYAIMVEWKWIIKYVSWSEPLLAVYFTGEKCLRMLY